MEVFVPRTWFLNGTHESTRWSWRFGTMSPYSGLQTWHLWHEEAPTWPQTPYNIVGHFYAGVVDLSHIVAESG